MADRISRKQRSRNMAAVRSKGNTTTELALIKIFRRYKISGWKRNQRVFGRPDFIFNKEKIALFIDGCFWHGCRWHGSLPESNRKFWREKIYINKKRDQLVNRKLRNIGWIVFRIWEHEINKDSASFIMKIRGFLHMSVNK